MKNIRLLRARIMDELYNNVPSNLKVYRSGSFDWLSADPSQFIELAQEFDEKKLSKVYCTNTDHREVDCCLGMYDAFKDVTRYLARDGRFWVYLNHTMLLPYARARWPIPTKDEEAAEHIRRHFFASGARGIERDNAASRLWWMAMLCTRVQGLTLRKALTAFLHQYDVRANIMERPTTAQAGKIFSALINKLYSSYKTDQALFERKKFRSVMKSLNLQGGVKLLDVLGESDINMLVDQYSK
jgi:hypothetical protein